MGIWAFENKFLESFLDSIPGQKSLLGIFQWEGVDMEWLGYLWIPINILHSFFIIDL